MRLPDSHMWPEAHLPRRWVSCRYRVEYDLGLAKTAENCPAPVWFWFRTPFLNREWDKHHPRAAAN